MVSIPSVDFDWTFLWQEQHNFRNWVSVRSGKGRRAFETKVEALIKASVPDDLKQLSSLFRHLDCNPNTRALLIYEAWCENGLELSTNAVELFRDPDQRAHAEAFLVAFKYFVYQTAFACTNKDTEFTMCLPLAVWGHLHRLLLPLAARELMNRLQSSSTGASSVSTP